MIARNSVFATRADRSRADAIARELGVRLRRRGQSPQRPATVAHQRPARRYHLRQPSLGGALRTQQRPTSSPSRRRSSATRHLRWGGAHADGAGPAGAAADQKPRGVRSISACRAYSAKAAFARIRERLDLYERATELDPSFANAFAAQAARQPSSGATTSMIVLPGPVARKEAYAKAPAAHSS